MKWITERILVAVMLGLFLATCSFIGQNIVLSASGTLPVLVTVTPAHLSPFEIPEGYYDQPCQMPEDRTFYEWFESLEPYGEWETGGWDCSQVSAWAEWQAENCGYTARIVVREWTVDTPGHAWVVVQIGDNWFPYEATSRSWLWPPWPEYDYIVDTLEGRVVNAETKWPFREWGWWETYPELWDDLVSPKEVVER